MQKMHRSKIGKENPEVFSFSSRVVFFKRQTPYALPTGLGLGYFIGGIKIRLFPDRATPVI
jgi:hypothetical protein